MSLELTQKPEKQLPADAVDRRPATDTVRGESSSLDSATMPGLDLSKPISVREYEGYEPTDIPGLGTGYRKNHRSVSQGHENFSYDLPLVSDGFGPCWAGILYDRSTGRTCMIHVDDYETKPNQRAKIERHLALPNSGQREAIIVAGSRTHASERSKKYFHDVGCERVTMIHADSQGMHWAVAFFPEQNVLDVVTKTGKHGSISTRYQAFTGAVYNEEERRTQHQTERLLQNTWTALNLEHYDKKWVEKNGHYSSEDFKKFVADAQYMFEEIGSAGDVQDLLISQGFAYLEGKTLVIPRLLHWSEPEISAPYYALCKTSVPFGRLSIYDTEDHYEFLTRMTHAFSGPLTEHLDANFLKLTSPEGDGEVLIHLNWDRISFHEIVEGDLMRLVINRCADIIDQTKPHCSFRMEGSSVDNWIPRFSPEHWKDTKDSIANMVEIMYRGNHQERLRRFW